MDIKANGNNIICVIFKNFTVVYYGGPVCAKVKYNGITGYCCTNILNNY